MASIPFPTPPHSSSSLSLHQCSHNTLYFPLSPHNRAIVRHPILKRNPYGLSSGFFGFKSSSSWEGGLFRQRKSGVFVGAASSMSEHPSNKGKPDIQHLKPTRYMQEKSSIVVIGLSVHTAPVEMREKLAIPEAEWAHAIADLCNLPHIEEAAVLSTCNRMEIYVIALSYHMGVQEVTQWMSKASGIPLHELQENLFILRERDMTNHLFRVAAGLDSLVLGEGQILAQVKHVYKVGQAEKGFGRTLAGLFKEAVTAGKRVRTETSIAVGAVSISSAAVELAASKLPQSGFAGARVLVVGAGKMGKLIVKHLVAKGCSKMTVVNRSELKVLDLQAEFPEASLQYRPFSDLMRCTSEADVVFTSTAAEYPLYDEDSVRSLPLAGAVVGGVRLFVDIAVPRNISASVGSLATAHLYNVDDLKEVVSANKEERRRKSLEAGTIIEEHVTSFNSWRESLETVPTIKKLRAYAERVRMAELEKCLGKMGVDVPTKRKKIVEELSRGIVNKLLHGPLIHLRCEGKEGRLIDETLENMQAVERMFDLQHETISVEGKLSTNVEQVQQH